MSAAAAPAGARPSGARLPPSPSTTLCRPEQLRARQRAAAQAAAEEDVQALQALLGGGGGGPAEGQHSGIAGPAPSQSGAAPAPADEGCLSSATLQSLLPAAPPTQAQLQPQAWLARQGSSWVAGPAAHQDAGQPPGLAGEPSALTSYIMRLEEESSLVQRQLAHLQASTSSCGGGGGAGQGALPSLSRTARNPLAPGRREVFVLSQWLEAETQRFNAAFARREEATPLVDFLLLAAARAKQMYSTAYAELARQVTRHCEDRGRLMADVWIGYGAMLDSVLSRVHAAYAAAKERAERAEAQLAAAEAQLEQERASAEAHTAALQDEAARLRAELAAAVAMGGRGGHADALSLLQAALRPAHSGGEGRPESASARGASMSPRPRVSTAGKRGGRRGSHKDSMAVPGGMHSLYGAPGDSGGLSAEEAEALQQQNAALQEALDAARQQAADAFQQVADLEAAADEAVHLESRAEAAENERDEALDRLRCATPRPPPSWDQLRELVGDAGLERFLAALEAHQHWPVDDVAALLAGAPLHAGASGAASRQGPAVAAEGSLAVLPAAESNQLAGSAAGSRAGSTRPTATGEGASSSGLASQQPRGSASGSARPTVTGDGGISSSASQLAGSTRPTVTGDGSSSNVGGGGGRASHLHEHVEAGLGCLGPAVSQGRLSREDILQAIQEGNAVPLVAAADTAAAGWLEHALSRPAAAPEALVDFLAGATRLGLPLDPAYYGCMQQYREGITAEQLRGAAQRARLPTKARMALLEEEARALRRECGELRGIVRGYRDAEQRRDAARRRREEEAALEQKTPLQQYVELLGSQDEAAWKEWLIGMGQSAGVPKLFRHSGKMRNRHLSKRDTEKLVKEMWRERMNDPAAAAGTAVDLLEFVFQQLQKKVGIMTAVVEAGYNFLYGLWKYQWDADCELFLRILLGEVKEDVYVAQVRLQEELEELFGAVDRAKGQATGLIDKDDLRTALVAFFKVGQPGGKTLKRFDELMQAMDEDQEGAAVEWRKVFEEDREFNQGEFAESIRDQFLQERVEFFKALEEAVYDEAGHEEECSKVHVVRALLRVNVDMPEKTAQQTAGAIFGDLEALGVKAVMRKLSRGVVQRSRHSSTKGSVVGAAAGLKARLKKGGGQLSENSLRALEALRQEWIAREVAKSAPPLPSSSSKGV